MYVSSRVRLSSEVSRGDPPGVVLRDSVPWVWAVPGSWPASLRPWPLGGVSLQWMPMIVPWSHGCHLWSQVPWVHGYVLPLGCPILPALLESAMGSAWRPVALKGPWRVFPRLLAGLEVWPQVAWLAVVQPYLSPLVITVVPTKGGCGGFSKSVQVTHLGYAWAKMSGGHFGSTFHTYALQPQAQCKNQLYKCI